jgi:hypothetical protein
MFSLSHREATLLFLIQGDFGLPSQCAHCLLFFSISLGSYFIVRCLVSVRRSISSIL